MKTRLLTTASIAAISALSFAQPAVLPPDSSTAPAATPIAQAGMAANQKAAPEDVEFVKMAGSGGLFELHSSQMATTASQNAEVKAFAQKMVQDHTAANQQLKGLAQQKNIAVPPAMAPKHQKMLEKLAEAEGQEFEALYVKQQVKAHEEAVALFEKAAAGAKDPDIKAFAATVLPALQAHLQQAKSLPGANN